LDAGDEAEADVNADKNNEAEVEVDHLLGGNIELAANNLDDVDRADGDERHLNQEDAESEGARVEVVARKDDCNGPAKREKQTQFGDRELRN